MSTGINYRKGISLVMVIKFNEIGTTHFHAKVREEHERKAIIDITFGPYAPVAIEVDELQELILFLQKAQQLFGLDPKGPEVLKVPTGTYEPTDLQKKLFEQFPKKDFIPLPYVTCGGYTNGGTTGRD
jgi:hypothetical protein